MSGGNLDSGAGQSRPPRTLAWVKKLAWALGALTVLFFGIGVAAVALSPHGDVPLEVGRALLTVALV